MPDPESGSTEGAVVPRERIERQREENVRLLAQQLRSPLGVLPFVGAGLSTPFGFPQWDALLRDLASDLPRQVRERVEAAIVREEYALAATIVSEVLDETFLQTAIAGRFPDEQLERIDLAETAVELVAHLTTGLVITTNFDGVLEHVFACSGSPFVDRVYGANPTQVIPAIQENRLVLWKIHGDRHDPRTRVLSSEEGAHR